MKLIRILAFPLLLISCNQEKKVSYSLFDSNKTELIKGAITYGVNDLSISNQFMNGHTMNGGGFHYNCYSKANDEGLTITVTISTDKHQIKKEIIITEKTPKEIYLGEGYKLKLKRTSGST